MPSIKPAEDKCIHEAFEQQVSIAPSRVALSFSGREISYGELNAQANRLAANLRKRGAAPETFIGVCLDLSIDAVVAVLAILKTGSAYVPLSPQEPFRRIDEIIEDTGLSTVVTRLGLRHRIPDSKVEILSVDEEFRLILKESPDNLDIPLTADDLAYVSYTSGSTGRPKGILATHRSATNGLADPPFDVHADEVCALSTPLRFGFSVSAIFLPLLSGKKLVIFPEAAIGDAERFIDILETEGVTSVVLVPSMLREILRQNTPLRSRLGKIRTLAVSGAALSRDLAEEVAEVFPGARLLNGYASSEIGGVAVVWEIRRNAAESGCAAGRPFPHTQVYILDESMEPAAPGSIGEIYISAPHLARGYLGQPGLTAERFLADSVGVNPGGRMYRTGDLGRLLADGRIEVLGRADDQVKIRGFRVELAEVEAVLREHPHVLDAIVTANADKPDDVRLTAYAVASQREPPSMKQLRDFVADRLPQYMVPAAFVLMEALPRTASGKVDRPSLPKPSNHGSPDNDHELPRTDVEITIARIWTDLLGVDAIGVHDNFLELGGHSLLAAQAISRMRELFNIQLSPREFLDRPTIAEQAREVEVSNSFGRQEVLGGNVSP